MSEHSIEELQRQVEVAYSRLRKAEVEHSVVKKRLHDRLCRESGFMGKIVEDRKNKISVLVNNVEFSGNKPWALRGFQVNADGKVGFRERRVWADCVGAIHDSPSTPNQAEAGKP